MEEGAGGIRSRGGGLGEMDLDEPEFLTMTGLESDEVGPGMTCMEGGAGIV